MNKILLVISGLLIATCGYAQVESEYYTNIEPEVSGVSSFGTFGNTPIDYYTGTPNISISLCVLKSYQLEVPVGLQYNSKGVRVRDAASWVGQNWELSVGGSVTRDLKGLPDELIDIGYLKTAKDTDYFQGAGFDAVTWTGHYQDKAKDTQPDEFIVSVPGRNIRFMLDKNGLAHTIPHSKVRIQTSTALGKIIMFKITMEDGAVYSFGNTSLLQNEGAIEETRIEIDVKNYHYEADGFKFFYNDEEYAATSDADVYNLLEASGMPAYSRRGTKEMDSEQDDATIIDWYNSKWHLVKIENPLNDHITFNYGYVGELTETHERTTEISQVMNWVEDQAKVFEVAFPVIWNGTPHSDNNWGPGSFAVINNIAASNDNGSGGQLITDSNDRPHLYDISLGKWMLNTAGGWSTNYDGPSQDGSAVLSRGKMVDVGLQGVIKFGFTDPGSAPLQPFTAYINPGDPVIKTNFTEPGWYEGFKYSEVIPNGGGTIETETTVKTKTMKLVSATTKSGARIDFNSVHDRMDMIVVGGQGTGVRLNDLSLYNNQNELVKKFRFDTETTNTVEEVYKRRLFLTGVVQLNKHDEALPAHSFEYHNKETLPNRQTGFQDAYGFASSGPLTGTLTKITYPTGGHTEYIYEPGGLRDNLLREVKNYSESGKLASHKVLEYDGSTAYVETPKLTTYQNIKLKNTNDFMKYKVVTETPQNNINLTKGSWKGFGLVREKNLSVEDGSESGYTEYKFTTPNTYDNGLPGFNCRVEFPVIASTGEEFQADGSPAGSEHMVDIFPFPPTRDKDHMRGLLRSKTVYKTLEGGSSQMLNQEEYNYQLNPYGYTPAAISGFTGGKFNGDVSSTTDYWYGREADPTEKTRSAITTYQADWVVMDKTIVTSYDQNDESKYVRSTTTFEYDPVNLVMVESRQDLEANKYAISKFKYVTDTDYDFLWESPNSCADNEYDCHTDCVFETLPPGQTEQECHDICEDEYDACIAPYLNTPNDQIVEIVKEMRSRNMINVPIEKSTWIEKDGVESLVSSQIVQYKFVGANNELVLPSSIWSLTDLGVGSTYISSYFDSNGNFQFNNSFYQTNSFDAYDPANGNLLLQRDISGISTSYEWGHNNTLVTKVTENLGIQPKGVQPIPTPHLLGSLAKLILMAVPPTTNTIPLAA